MPDDYVNRVKVFMLRNRLARLEVYCARLRQKLPASGSEAYNPMLASAIEEAIQEAEQVIADIQIELLKFAPLDGEKDRYH